MKKKCRKCGLTKNESEFNFKNKKKRIRQHACKVCTRKASKDHYDKAPRYYIEKRDRHRRKAQQWIKELKSRLRCECGEDHPACIVFHHNDPKEKELSIAVVVRYSWGIERIQKEVDKCTPMCSNCHNKLHWPERL